MKVVILSTNDLQNGAGIAAYRLHQGLQKFGVESSMLVSEKLSDDEYVYYTKKPPKSSLGRVFRKIENLVAGGMGVLGPQNIYSSASRGVIGNTLIEEADVINVHIIHGIINNFSLLLLPYLNKKPLVWTFHDMWPLTGRCSYDLGCGLWKKGCGKCPELWYPEKLVFDISGLQWKLKKNIYTKIQPVIVAPSKWLMGIIKESPMFKHCSVENIPNGIDLSVFKPVNKKKARDKFGIPSNKKVILFIAMSKKARRKGCKYFEEAMMHLTGRVDDISLVTVGKEEVSEKVRAKFQVKQFGYVKDPTVMREIYSLSDLLIMPSIQDNLPNILLESLACGLPSVSFKAGGVPDIIGHMENGYLAKNMDVNDLREGIEMLLGDNEFLDKVKSNTRKTVEEKFTLEKQLDGYIELYKQVIKQHRK